VRGGESIDLSFGQVLSIPDVAEGWLIQTACIRETTTYRSLLGSLTAYKCEIRSSILSCFKPILTESL